MREASFSRCAAKSATSTTEMLVERVLELSSPAPFPFLLTHSRIEVIIRETSDSQEALNSQLKRKKRYPSTEESSGKSTS